MNQVPQSTSIYALYKEGTLAKYEDCGILKPHVIPYCRYYEEYMRQRAMGLKFIEAVEATADAMCTSPDTIKRAIAMVI